ncbi:hypothetical protein [Streptomyces sp. NPDC051364]|uniref:hypothetical protein n=1 Tax=Streptomyces sp. NPDC051364 TaxID=3155799 RepID=UPI00342C5BE8
MTETGPSGQIGAEAPKPTTSVTTALDVHFPPVPNGVDYLVSVVRLLRREKGEGDPSPHDLKYAVLHLQAACEVLLKARLRQEHWTLVIKDASQTSKQKYDDGEFDSPTTAETIRRLVQVVGVQIEKRDKEAILALAGIRNQLQHWGLTESAAAVESRAADVLDFLIRFLDEELLEKIDADQRAAIADNMLEVRSGLGSINGYVTIRMDRLRIVLKDVADHTVQCPDCTQFALHVDGAANKCLYCPRPWKVDQLAVAYATKILDQPRIRRYYKGGGKSDSWSVDLGDLETVLRDELCRRGLGWPGETELPAECPNCQIRALVGGVATALAPDQLVNMCFNCTETFEGLES